YFVDKEVFQFLREIKNGVYIQNLCDEIDDKYNDIPKTKALIQSGGGASNSHIYNLYKANVGLKNFIEDNFIIGNGYSMISTAFQKSINAFLVGYSIKFIKAKPNLINCGSPYLEFFNHFLVRLIASQAKPDEFFKIIKNNDLRNIEICEKEINEITNSFSNFFKSAYVENDKWFYTIKENDTFISEIISDRGLSDKISKTLNNILIILSYFNFPEIQLNQLFKKLVNFIKYVKFPYRTFDYKYLKYIIHEKQDLIDVEEINNLLQVYIENKKYDSNFLQILHFLKDKEQGFILSGIDFSHFSLEENYSQFEIIYQVLNQDDRVIFKKHLEKYLQNQDANEYSFFLAME